MADALILAFDTSAAHCAAALISGNQVRAARGVAMGRGQAEALFPMLEALLTEAGAGWHDLDAIGVGIGPGNFTGIRISVAAARGLALSLGIPAIGVSGFEATAPELATPHWAVISGPRDSVYAQRRGETDDAPVILPQSEVDGLDAEPILLADLASDQIAINIAQVAARRWQDDNPRPKPLYIRLADAAPMRDSPPVILP